MYIFTTAFGDSGNLLQLQVHYLYTEKGTENW